MRLRRTGGATDAVAARAAAQQDDLVARGRGLTAHMVGGSGRDDRADLHALGHIAGMVDLVDLAGGQTDLVAVRRITVGRRGDEFALGELALKRLIDRRVRVGGARDAHRLIHVGAPRERVADAAADAGGRTAERFDLGGVVVRLVLEEEQPVLVFAVHVDLHLDGARVDLLGLVEAGHHAIGLEPLGAERAHVHQGDRAVGAAQFVAHRQIALERGLHHGVVDRHRVELRAERGVAAVVGPIGVDHTDLGDGRVASLLLEIPAAELEVGHIHRQTAVRDETLHLLGLHRAEPVDHLDLAREGHLRGERVFHLEARLARFDRIDHVMFHRVHIGCVQRAVKCVDGRGAHGRAFALADELDALARRIGALVKLAGQVLHGEHGVLSEIRQIKAHIV